MFFLFFFFKSCLMFDLIKYRKIFTEKLDLRNYCSCLRGKNVKLNFINVNAFLSSVSPNIVYTLYRYLPTVDAMRRDLLHVIFNPCTRVISIV